MTVGIPTKEYSNLNFNPVNDNDNEYKYTAITSNYIPIATMTDGQSFGEISLSQNKPWNATIYTNTDCYFATLTKWNYNEKLAKID